MMPIKTLSISIPILAGFGLVFWFMIFLNNFRHFPKMDSKKRLWMSILNATILTLVLVAIIFLFLWLILQYFLK